MSGKARRQGIPARVQNKAHAGPVHSARDTVERFAIEAHMGPLPHPGTLQGYNEVLPGLAERIVSMTEKEGDHRRTMERKSAWREFFTTILGQIFAFSTTVLLVGLAAYLLMNGKDVAGFISMGTAVIPSVTAIYLNKKGA